MKHQSCETHSIQIYIAGDLQQCKNACREYCDKHGFCVTVTPTDYVYTGGEESGVIVGLINYPRFPVEPHILFSHAYDLAKNYLIPMMEQDTCTIMSPNKSFRLIRNEAWERRK